MSPVNASADVIRQFKSDLSNTINEIRAVTARVRSLGSGEWNDAQGEQLRALVQKIAQLVESPIGTLQAAQPKLDKLAQSLDAYGKVRF